jgi:general secretion pathway protein I
MSALTHDEAARKAVSGRWTTQRLVSLQSRGGPTRAAAGFTFLELLVSLAILGSAFVILLSAHTSAARLESRARRLMTASLLARQIVTDTELNGVPDLGGDDGDFGEEFPEYAWERNVATPDLPIPITSVDVREVHIQVTWPDRGGTDSMDLVFYKVKPL